MPLNRNSERIPRRFRLTAVVLPGGSVSAARAAGSFNVHAEDPAHCLFR